MTPSSTRESTKVTLIPGDGIGPEVTSVARRLIDATGVKIDWEPCDAGEQVFARGLASGVPRETLDSIQRTKLVLKGPLGTPVGTGQKSANVTLRKLFEAYANVRPVREMPGVPTPFAGRGVDLVIVRENVEDLYAGIEHMQTPNVAQCLKLMSRTGCEKIARFAFELARAEGRHRVACATKANIMKMTEGMLKRTFEEAARDYPDVEARHILVDNCAHQLVKAPEQFEVIVTSNMNGDILSDLTSGLVGGLGFAPSANIGSDVAMFEPVHGSAPDIAGRGVANPTAMILSGVMLLRHLGELEAADRLESATLRALWSGVYTRDVREEGAVSTEAFGEAVGLGFDKPSGVAPARAYRRQSPALTPALRPTSPTKRRPVGVDIFVEAHASPAELGAGLEEIARGTSFRLKMISNRGTKVYPPVGALVECVDHWRCRFQLEAPRDEAEADRDTLALIERLGRKHRWMHVEKLFEIDGVPAFSKAQGED